MPLGFDGPTGTVVPESPDALVPPPAAAADPEAAALEAPPAADDAGADADDEDPLDEHAAASPAASSAPAIMATGRRLPGDLHLLLFPFIGHYPHSHWTCLRWLYVESGDRPGRRAVFTRHWVAQSWVAQGWG